MRKFLCIEDNGDVKISWIKAENIDDAYEIMNDRFGGSIVILDSSNVRELKKVINKKK